ncbi:hypothetical protein DV735_g3014, partial [Chaetothyriales sp. CBS 134920]
MDEKQRISVAIVGSGLAGLVTAYLLQQDDQSRYAVTLFEEGDVLSLDSASVSLPVRDQSRPDRIDLPMRAFAGGYYPNLRAMYEYLGVEYQAQQFLYSFSKNVSIVTQEEDINAGSISPKMKWRSYFAHSSNLHRMPGEPPQGMPLSAWLMEILYVLVCYIWFSASCRFQRPRPADSTSNGERLDEYLHRIRLPNYFVTYYVLPVLSSIATCSHTELLNFPAADVTGYKSKIQGEQHYRVCNGVQDVESKLSRGINKRLSTRVLAVEPESSAFRIRWVRREDASGQAIVQEELFDRAVLAVTPNVVAKVFRPLQHEMAQIPTVSVESVVHAEGGRAGERASHLAIGGEKNIDESNRPLVNEDAAQTISFRTSLADGQRRTEAVHIQPSGALVTTCPFSHIDPAQVIKSSRFTRVLRTPESRRITNDIFGDSSLLGEADAEKRRFSNLRLAQAGGCFVLGVLFLPLVKSIQTAITRSNEGEGDGDGDGNNSIYGLDHGRLNLVVPPPTMWMNMGYWELTSEFPLACRALLDEVLITAKLLPRRQDRSHEFKQPHALTIIDLGFGCGDQTVHLMGEAISQELNLVDARTGLKRRPRRLVDRYDAAQPASWSEDLARAAVREKATGYSYSPPSGQEQGEDDRSSHGQTWVLALDSLYHFSPSRQPIINQAYHKLEASLMAFDLILADGASRLDCALLAVVCVLAAIPFANFLTAAQYRKMLCAAGLRSSVGSSWTSKVAGIRKGRQYALLNTPYRLMNYSTSVDTR